ncbi:hypothetical protein GCM10007989_04820 [Devosia pacifica]|uniref:DUF4234 domain-containing protein n=1 Tax=Devosia pacifica TaxID=1335967 RepID=A0A918RVR1_9HYPH|nr:DUF6693 family protein [Devosia pacifica]GHA13273.1 hypothetical protein GCM10007989_04820 [Devosia pacifica]
MDNRAVSFKAEFGIIDTIGVAVIWILLTIVTLGLALAVFPYYFNKDVLNKTKVLDANGHVIGRLNCRFSLVSSVGHVIIWILLIIFTLGIAAFFYAYRVLRVVMNETEIEYFS